MKVLLISYGFMLQRAYQWKAIALRELVEDVVVLVPREWKELWASGAVSPEPGPLQEVEHRSVKIHFNINKHFALLPPRELKRVLTVFKPDVIEFDNEPFNMGSSQVMAAVKHHAPSSRVYFHAAQNLMKRYPPPFNWLEQYVFASCAGVFARNEAAAQVLRARGCEPSKIHQMGHGVSLREFESARVRQRMRGAIEGSVLYVGAMTEQKGVDLLIRACAQVEGCQRLVLAGSGPLEKEFKTLAKDLGIMGQCEFRGQVAHRDLVNLYGEASCLVFPSRTTANLVEQFGRVLLEAMAAGCPIIASDSGNIPNVVGDAGLVVPENEPAALAETLRAVLSDEPLRGELRERGVRRIQQEFEWSVIASRMVDVFDGGVGGGTGQLSTI